MHAAWADTILSVGQFPAFRLHALFVARSPVLYSHLCAGQSPPYRIELNVEDVNLTPVAISMALATLYGHSLDLRTVDIAIAKGLIAAGSLLGLEVVAASGAKSLMSLISKETIGEVFDFALSGGKPSDTGDIMYPGPYPMYTKALVQYLIDYLLANFNASETPLDPVFFNVLLDLPFNILKYICESEKLVVSGHMGRHQFACAIASERQKRVQGDAGALFEENAILSFKNGKGKVELIRRPVGKRKVLWKAGR